MKVLASPGRWTAPRPDRQCGRQSPGFEHTRGQEFHLPIYHGPVRSARATLLPSMRPGPLARCRECTASRRRLKCVLLSVYAGAVAGKPVDHLPAQPMAMMFSARHSGALYIDYTNSAKTLAECQLKMVQDFRGRLRPDVLGPGSRGDRHRRRGQREVVRGPGTVINEERAALLDKARLRSGPVPDPHREEGCTTGSGLSRSASKNWPVRRPSWVGSKARWPWPGVARAQPDHDRRTGRPGLRPRLDGLTSEVAIVYAARQIEAGADTIGMSDAAASMIGPGITGTSSSPATAVSFNPSRRHPSLLRQHMCG